MRAGSMFGLFKLLDFVDGTTCGAFTACAASNGHDVLL